MAVEVERVVVQVVASGPKQLAGYLQVRSRSGASLDVDLLAEYVRRVGVQWFKS